MSSLLIRAARPDDERPLRRRRGDVSIRDGASRDRRAPRRSARRVVDARGGYILPGLIQTHIISVKRSSAATPTICR
jgi:cytosine/adenosine deaminase-related metal-dependent hydrolase